MGNSGNGEFFPVSLKALDLIAASGGGAEVVLAYLVLARHATAKGRTPNRLSSAGVFAIQNKGGLTRGKAEAAIVWLKENKARFSTGETRRFIVPAEEARERLGTTEVPEHFGDGKNGSRRTEVRWWLNPFDDLLYLSNSLIDGVGAGKGSPPLNRIYSRSEPDFGAGISTSQARLDAAMLLIHLYRHHLLEECGGVDPRCGLYREWKLAETPTELEFNSREPVTAMKSSDAALYEVEGTPTTTMWTRFAESALSYISDQEVREERFWCAFHNLKWLGLVYEVLTIWNRNPLTSKTAELEYTLYIFDRHAREAEPFLQREIHAMAMHRGEIDYADLVPNAFADDGPTLLTSGRFRFIATKKSGAHPLGVFRLRFRPKTRDTALGIEAERQRCLRWGNACRKLAERPPMTEWIQPQQGA